MGRLRLYFGKRLNLIDESKHALLWVVDFPMFEWSDEENRFMAMHHPFTSPCMEDLDKLKSGDLGNVKSIAYDIVYNGTELGGGSVRIHSSEVQSAVFKALGLTEDEAKEKFGNICKVMRPQKPIELKNEPSTIVDFTGNEPKILRQGSVILDFAK